MFETDIQTTDTIPREVLKDSNKLFTYIVIKYIYPRYNRIRWFPSRGDFDKDSGYIPINYNLLFGPGVSFLGDFAEFKKNALFLCNLLQEYRYRTCIDIMMSEK